MSNHTPGPWYIGTDFSDQARHIYAEKMVCDDDGEEWHPLIASTDDDERLIDWQANARLIAAAPEMFAALQWFDEQMRDDSALDMGKLINEMEQRTRAAIAKATQDETP
jgi:hypothetical protein